MKFIFLFLRNKDSGKVGATGDYADICLCGLARLACRPLNGGNDLQGTQRIGSIDQRFLLAGDDLQKVVKLQHEGIDSFDLKPVTQQRVEPAARFAIAPPLHLRDRQRAGHMQKIGRGVITPCGCTASSMASTLSYPAISRRLRFGQRIGEGDQLSPWVSAKHRNMFASDGARANDGKTNLAHDRLLSEGEGVGEADSASLANSPFTTRPTTVNAAGIPRIKKTLSKLRLSAIISAPAKALRMAPIRPTPCIQLEPVARAWVG